MSTDVGARADFRDRCAHSRRDLAAAFGCWEDLSGVEGIGSAEGGLEPRHHFQIVRGEYPRHIIALLVPYAVFAGDGTAGGIIPLPIIADTARDAWVTASKIASKVTVASGLCSNRTITFVTMARVPSDPTTTPVRS